MMDGRQKSDLGIVARKRANNPEQPGAESAERRPGAKGNTVGPRTDRTQGRTLPCPSDSTVYGKQRGSGNHPWPD